VFFGASNAVKLQVVKRDDFKLEDDPALIAVRPTYLDKFQRK
jgi:hypothetical protein